MSVTDRSASVVPEEIEALDFQPPCQLVNCPHRSKRTWQAPPATHVGRMVCGCTRAICRGCAEDHLREMRKKCRISCWLCGHQFGKVRLGDVLEITPL